MAIAVHRLVPVGLTLGALHHHDVYVLENGRHVERLSTLPQHPLDPLVHKRLRFDHLRIIPRFALANKRHNPLVHATLQNAALSLLQETHHVGETRPKGRPTRLLLVAHKAVDVVRHVLGLEILEHGRLTDRLQVLVEQDEATRSLGVGERAHTPLQLGVHALEHRHQWQIVVGEERAQCGRHFVIRLVRLVDVRRVEGGQVVGLQEPAVVHHLSDVEAFEQTTGHQFAAFIHNRRIGPNYSGAVGVGKIVAQVVPDEDEACAERSWTLAAAAAAHVRLGTADFGRVDDLDVVEAFESRQISNVIGPLICSQFSKITNKHALKNRTDLTNPIEVNIKCFKQIDYFDYVFFVN